MLQDIAPEKYHCEYREHLLGEKSILLIFQGNSILVRRGEASIFPVYGEIKERLQEQISEITFLFSIGEKEYFLFAVEADIHREKIQVLLEKGYSFVKVRGLRNTAAVSDCFAASTGYHLYTGIVIINIVEDAPPVCRRIAENGCCTVRSVEILYIPRLLRQS